MDDFSILISGISLIISCITLYRQRKRITVTWGDNLYVLNPQTDIIFNGSPYPANADVAFYTSVQIINPGHSNMAFFDLRAFNPRTNENHFIATQRTCLPEVQNNSIFISAFGIKYLDNFFIKLPERNFGNLSAGSYTSVDILIFANRNVCLDDGIRLSLKVTNTSWFSRSRYSNTNRKIYKAYEKKFDLTGYTDVLEQKRQHIMRNNS